MQIIVVAVLMRSAWIMTLKSSMEVIMKRLNTTFIFILIFVIILLAGCKKISIGTYDASEDEGTELTSVPDDNPEVSGTDDDDESEDSKDISDKPSSTNTEKITPTTSAIKPPENDDLPVFTVNPDTGDVEPVSALVPQGSEKTPQLIVDTVVDSLADQSIKVEIDYVKQEKNTVIVSFKKDASPSKNAGSGYEAAILDAFAQSLVDNLGVKVIFRIEDEAYVSGVFEYGINEVYPLGDN